MKNNLDERQKQVVGVICEKSFYVMFLLSIVVIMIQFICFNAKILTVAGETCILLGGGLTYLIGSMKNGIRYRTSFIVIGNFVYSILCSGVFSILYGIIIKMKSKSDGFIEKYVGIFFVGITILCFAVLTTLDKLTKKW